MRADDAFGPDGEVAVTGHRGAAGAAPENTVSGLEHARDVGVDAVEVDLHATADDRLVLLHDDTVDRTTDGTGPVEAMTLGETRRLDAGHAFTPDRGRSFPFRGEGVTIPTLDEAMEAAGDLPVVLEAKSARAARLLVEWLGENPDDAGRVMVGGPGLPAAGVMEEAGRRARWRCASKGELRPYVLLGKIGLGGPFAPDVDALMVPERHRLLKVVTGRLLRQAHGDGLGVHVWTVNRADRMRRLFDLGVDGLLSDVPGRARRVLDERAARG
jgi:glycerophosphoryl diester phosphodiesterase